MAHVQCHNVVFTVPGRTILNRLDLTAAEGEVVAIMGPSGSGKTTLLNCLCGITSPDSGSVIIAGIDLMSRSIEERTAFRLRHIGLVFQFGEFLPELSVIENVALPLRLLGTHRKQAEQMGQEWLRRLRVPIDDATYPGTLSGGELQRAGIARALAHRPALVLADEPTGALDETNARQVAELLIAMAKQEGTTVILGTHDPLVAQRADRRLHLHAGALRPMQANTPSPTTGVAEPDAR